MLIKLLLCTQFVSSSPEILRLSVNASCVHLWVFLGHLSGTSLLNAAFSVSKRLRGKTKRSRMLLKKVIFYFLHHHI